WRAFRTRVGNHTAALRPSAGGSCKSDAGTRHSAAMPTVHLHRVSFSRRAAARPRILAGLLVVLVALAANAMAARRTAADQPRDISKHLQVIRKRHALPGIVGAIVQGNRI